VTDPGMVDVPLHVQVAEALGWTYWSADGRAATHCVPPGTELDVSDNPVVALPLHEIPHFDTDWSATGPLIERYEIDVWRSARMWKAAPDTPGGTIVGRGTTPLIAICHLILALKADGKLCP
jgi:hypothetical protein